MEIAKDLRLAVLIDADNVPYSNIKGMLEEMAKYGTPTFKRIYADWTKPTVSGWKSVLLESAITPIHQYSYTTGKNATDSSMIIDAMDILYSGKVDGFCIVSSDSDFTRLAIRLREAGMKVFGFGERKTPTAFISACDKFVYIEILSEDAQEAKPAQKNRRSNKRRPEASAPGEADDKKRLSIVTRDVLKLISDSVEDLADESGWAYLGDLGNLLIKKQSDFDPRNYGFQKLVLLIKSLKIFDIEKRDTAKGNVKHVYVKLK
ncbi:MAG TPA: NYN domain-containing protein [Chryseolinea sp.]|nr:NYN domain-containing protein [Chryseolinea sp.]